MTKRSEWRQGTELQKTSVALPRSVWEGAKVRAMKEGRTLQELVADAVTEYLKRDRKGER
jgi:hypothetical protein